MPSHSPCFELTCSLLMQQTSLSDSTLPSVISVGISSSIIAGKHVVLSFNGVRFCKPISYAGPCCQADLCHMKSVKVTTINVNVVTCINENIYLGGTTTPLDMIIDFKVLSAKALMSCKNIFIADNVACIMEDLNELLRSSCLDYVLARLMRFGVQFFPPVIL